MRTRLEPTAAARRKHNTANPTPEIHPNPTHHPPPPSYPAGESYLDVIQRLEPAVIEMERGREFVAVVAHQAVRVVASPARQEGITSSGGEGPSLSVV